jgi:hypothetical protein
MKLGTNRMPQIKKKLKAFFFGIQNSTLLEIGNFSLEYPLVVYILTDFLYGSAVSKGGSVPIAP